MEKRYQVFVSSTYTDLTVERAAVIQAIQRMDHLPAGMELFPAADESQWEVIEQVIDQSDYYVVVVAGRYGSISDADGISYTEKEYDYAVSSGIPVLGFVHKDPANIPAKDSELDPKARELLDKFREKVQSKPVNFFETSAELGGLVITSLIQAMKKNPRVGWVRGNLAMTVEQEREMVSLREQVATLKEEKRAAESALVEDTSQLAHGDEPVTLWAGARNRNRPREQKRAKVTTTWDSIFSDIAPEMVDEAVEDVVRSRLANHLIYNISDEGMETLRSIDNPKPFVYDDDWDKVKVQFRALGLIDRGEKKRPVNDTNKYLRLTDRGDRHLTQLLAVRSVVDPEAEQHESVKV